MIVIIKELQILLFVTRAILNFYKSNLSCTLTWLSPNNALIDPQLKWLAGVAYRAANELCIPVNEIYFQILGGHALFDLRYHLSSHCHHRQSIIALGGLNLSDPTSAWL